MKKLLLTALIIGSCSMAFSQSVARFYTRMGNWDVYLEDTLAPITAGNFIGLVDQKYYDGVLFHRVIVNFMIQGGDATLTGGSRAPVIQDEFHDSLSNVKGTISMANAGPNTGTSQFFINVKDNTYLDYNKSPFTSKHPVFGHVANRYSVVESISQVATTGRTGGDRPLTDIAMDSVRIVSRYIPASVEFKVSEEQVMIYPNPSSGRLNIQLGDLNPEMIVVMDMTGKVVFEILDPRDLITFDLSDHPKGLYYLQIVGDKFSSTRRVSIQ